LGAEETAELFAKKNGCQSPRERSIPDRDQTDNTVVTRITWSRCRSGKNVTLYRIEGGGHQIPGGRTMMRMLMGATNNDISAAEIIMSAFGREDARGKR
jgi:polyhydroxybutyrate depolymerase